jgi:opacity protein-like surface antigen
VKRLAVVSILAAVCAMAAAAADVTGKWTGTFALTRPDGEKRDTGALLVLKQSGSEITGTVGPNENEQHAITKGSIEGDKIALLVEADGRAVKFNLVLAADKISGDVDIAMEGQSAKAKIDVTRAK